ncbi:MFS transporter [Asticcacaulis sp. 201]|uniref:MFS transporter n=1 Tax=Asticcacaulis sp. 201 TaxID=3028787 RepID=UPI0029164DFD|nr:MFS transporter [Asticcacaulis sp. 201]MDV6332550.1 MFS transporter [Asticcacaulis sp. 201]
MPLALYALTIGAFGIGVTEFVIMGLLLDVGHDFHVTVSKAGLLISGYALGVVAGAPLLTGWMSRWPQKTALIVLMLIFTIGNIACALAPNYGLLMTARVITALAHGSFFGIGSVLATSLVPTERRASAVALMFTGLTVANVLGVPFGTWLGQHYGWRATFWAVGLIGVAAMAVLAAFVPHTEAPKEVESWKSDFRIFTRRPVLLGLLTTVLGFAGVFAVFTYIAPLLTTLTGFSESAVAPILLVFGGGLVIGNLLGGRLADRNLVDALLGAIIALFAVLVSGAFALHNKVGAVLFVFGLGVTGFATVPPLQIWVLGKAEGSGQSLASSFNIAAFNLGNAIGAWVGGAVIAGYAQGLNILPWVAAILPISAFAVAWLAIRLERKPQLA